MANSLDFLHGVETQEIVTATATIQTATSSIIGLLMTAGKGPVNTPTLISGSPRQGVTTFGVFADDGFTGPEALSGIFQQIGAMVICVNVCDPTKHFSSKSAESITFGTAFTAVTAKPYISSAVFGPKLSAPVAVTSAGLVIPYGTTLDSITSLDGTTTYVKGTDYTVTPSTTGGATVITATTGGAFPASGNRVLVNYEHGGLTLGTDYTLNPDIGTFTRVNSGKILPYATVTLASYNYVDPSKVTDVDIIGSEDTYGNYLGAQAFYGAQDALDITPRILIAPHWTHQKENAITANPVVAALLGVAQQIKAIIYADGPDTNDADAVAYVNDWGSDRIMVCDPWDKILGPNDEDWLVPMSITQAGLTAQTDNAVGFWASPSNKIKAGVIGAGRTVDFRMGSTSCRANYLNSLNISTTIRSQGIRSWGNHMTDGSFITDRRTADMVEESIQASHLWAVDRVITKNFLQEVLANVGAYLRHLQQVGAIYGGSAWIDRDLNTDDVIAGGQLYINYAFTTPKTAEHLTFQATITNDYISNIFSDLSLTLANTSILNVSSIQGLSTG